MIEYHLKTIKQVYKWEVFNVDGNFYVNTQKDITKGKPIVSCTGDDMFYSYTDFPDEVGIVGMMFITPDK